MKFQGNFKEISRKFQGLFKGFSRVFKLKKFQGCFESVSRKFTGCLMCINKLGLSCAKLSSSWNKTLIQLTLMKLVLLHLLSAPPFPFTHI